MTIEVLGLILSAIQVIQGFKGGQGGHPQLTKADVVKLLNTLSPLYDLLIDAKNLHDFLESITQDLQSLETEPPRSQARELLAKSVCNRIKRHQHPIIFSNVKISTPEEVSSKPLSPTLKNALNSLMAACPSCTNSTTALKGHFDNFCRLCDTRNWGTDFEQCVIFASNVCTQAKFDADKVIFHLVPIISDLFHETREAVK